jgi:hypothetical protein
LVLESLVLKINSGVFLLLLKSNSRFCFFSDELISFFSFYFKAEESRGKSIEVMNAVGCGVLKSIENHSTY